MEVIIMQSLIYLAWINSRQLQEKASAKAFADSENAPITSLEYKQKSQY